ncbi:hypothetical protein IMZ31_23655 (plasmid) [Pontibacillus sp. ALD_SL1]|uniref:hypothetical protein n=1 Tax=Pontibacillus sp. ALD_SL1 TaxID=2777185 RepID=UPI001A97808E|nr:hypothetical protein [Pontibacillus sp. ALD_SL1]QST02448.1 hypothetical protein IMZ31_23655 [Pontibacillus sp. ALD_SL1]
MGQNQRLQELSAVLNERLIGENLDGYVYEGYYEGRSGLSFYFKNEDRPMIGQQIKITVSEKEPNTLELDIWSFDKGETRLTDDPSAFAEGKVPQRVIARLLKEQMGEGVEVVRNPTPFESGLIERRIL